MEPQALAAVADDSGISLKSAYEAVMTKDLDKDKLAVIERLVAIDAERRFNTAFVGLQQELPVISGIRGIPDKQGNIKFAYANFEDIDEIVRPICFKHGFCYSFKETGYHEGKVTTMMMLTHSGGHTREIPCTVRIGSGAPGTSESQNDMGAHTFGKRGALELGLCLRIVGNKEDAKLMGNQSEKITLFQADELERRVKETNSNVQAFLKFAGAAKFSEIPANKYDALDQMLRRKEQVGK